MSACTFFVFVLFFIANNDRNLLLVMRVIWLICGVHKNYSVVFFSLYVCSFIFFFEHFFSPSISCVERTHNKRKCKMYHLYTLYNLKNCYIYFSFTRSVFDFDWRSKYLNQKIIRILKIFIFLFNYCSYDRIAYLIGFVDLFLQPGECHFVRYLFVFDSLLNKN